MINPNGANPTRIPDTAVPPSEWMTAEEQASAQLRALFPGPIDQGDQIELRFLHQGGEPPAREFHISVEAAVEAAMRWKDSRDVYFGVGLRRCPETDDTGACPHKTKGLDHVSLLPAVWADLDVSTGGEASKPYQSIEDVLHALNGAPIRPDILVGSGAGIHCYWLIEGGTRDRAAVRRVNVGIQTTLCGDHVADPTRILRLAGTFNHKHGTPLPVRLLRCGVGDAPRA